MNALDTPPVFNLPAAMRNQGYSLRPETESDTPFLMRLYASTRELELAAVPWTAEVKAAFLAQQFHAQRHHYRTHIPDCRFDVLEFQGAAIGRLYLQGRATRFYIVDIAIAPEWRGRGVGTAILQAMQAAGRASGRGVGIMVERFNPAMRLYRRLGFADVETTDVHVEMEWLPARTA